MMNRKQKLAQLAAVAQVMAYGACIEAQRRFGRPRQLDMAAQRVAAGVGTLQLHDLDAVVRFVSRTAEVLQARQLGDPRSQPGTWAEITIRVSITIPKRNTFAEGLTGTFTGCYRFTLARHAASRPRRVGCPPGAQPIIAPPPPPVDAIVPGTVQAIRAVLSELPPTATAAQIEAAVRAAVPEPEVDPANNLPRLPPRIAIGTRPGNGDDDAGPDVGVAVFARQGRHCVLINRIDGVLESWSPPWVVMQPGEGSCDAHAALNGLHKRHPH